MQKEEDYLSSLANLLLVSPPRRIPNTFVENTFVNKGELWPKGSLDFSNSTLIELMKEAREGSSENWIKLALALAVAKKQAGADALAIQWLTELKTQNGWDGTEIGCRNDYWLYHRAADLIFTRCGSPELSALAWESLDLFKFWASTGCPITGQRSAVPGKEQYELVDECADYVSGKILSISPVPPTIDRMVLLKMLPELVILKSRKLSNPLWKTATKVTFYIGKDKSLVISDSSINNNTLAVLAASQSFEGNPGSKKREWLPTPPFGVLQKDGSVTRIREIADTASCLVDEIGKVASYVGKIFKNSSLSLPVSYAYMTLGSGFTTPVLPGQGETTQTQKEPVVQPVTITNNKKNNKATVIFIISAIIILIVVVSLFLR